MVDAYTHTPSVRLTDHLSLSHLSLLLSLLLSLILLDLSLTSLLARLLAPPPLHPQLVHAQFASRRPGVHIARAYMHHRRTLIATEW